MANTNCNSIADTISINITNTDLPSGFCHNSMDETLDAFVAVMSASVVGEAASFTAGDGEPIAGDRNKLWFKQDASTCKPLGWQWWNGSASPPAWEYAPNPLSAIYDASDTAGAVAYHDGTKWTVLAPGTAGQVLQSNGTSAPSWVNSGPTIVQASTTTGDSNTTSSFEGTGLSASITPSATTSKVLVTVTQIHTVTRVSGAGTGGAYSAKSQLKNGSSVIWGPHANIAGAMQDNYPGVETGNISITYLPEPASTSSQTYSVEHAIASNAQTSTAGAGTITLTEIK